MRLLFCLLALAVSLSAASVSMTNATPYVVAAGDINSASYSQTTGATFAGVARLILTRSDGTFICTGTVIGDTSILTAGHCASGGGATATTSVVQALLTDGLGNSVTLNTSSYIVHPTWNGALGASTDLAVFNFSSAFPNWVTRYGLYTLNNELNQTFTVAGFGMTGSFGAAATGAAGAFHQGQNVWERLLSNMGIGATVDNLVMDFDNGTTTNDAFGRFYGLTNTGLGTMEVNTAPGDSGGPSFIAGQLAGVTSFGFTLSGGVQPDCVVVTPTNTPNSSCGEFSSMVRVSSNIAWIQGAMVPEPSTYATVLIGLAALLAAHRWR